MNMLEIEIFSKTNKHWCNVFTPFPGIFYSHHQPVKLRHALVGADVLRAQGLAQHDAF